MLAPLSSHTPVEEPADKQFDRKPTLLGWQAHLEPTGRNPERYGTTATPTRIIQSGTSALGYTARRQSQPLNDIRAVDSDRSADV